MDKALFSTGSTEWETPDELFGVLNKLFRFDIDLCATAENAKCKRYYSPQDDALAQKWKGQCWCNPPYGRDIEKWVKKAHESQSLNTSVVMLLPARTDTKWIHKYVFGEAHILFLKGRLKFGSSGNSAPFPSMIALFGETEQAAKRLAAKLDCYLVLRGKAGEKK